MTYTYIRVSTQEQNLENQRKCISDLYKVDEFIEEKRSGTIDYLRRDLGGLIKRLNKGDTVIATEISRFGRSMSMIFKIMTELKDKGIRVIAIKNNFDLNPSKKNDIVANVLMFAFGLSAQIERNLISERTKQGLAVAKQNGKRIGRQKGDVVYNVKLRKWQNEIMQKYEIEKRSINSLAKEYNVKWSTMKKFITVYSKI
jgi:DNA invertase Pin-like site-specific DNA recombinase